MRSWKRSLSVAVACVLGVVLLTPITAQASRRAALHGDFLIEDVTDVYLMPQLLGKYRNLIRLHMGQSTDNADGLLIFGNDTMAFALAAHRSDNLDPRAGVLTTAAGSESLVMGARSPFGTSVGASPGTIFDAMLSINMGEAAALGFRLAVANGGTSAGPDGEGPSVTNILIEGGYSMFGDLRLDLALFLALGLGSDSTGGGDASATNITIGVTGRAYLPMEDQVELGLFGNLGVGFGSSSSGDVDGPSTFDLDIAVGAGPVYKLEHARIAAYAMLGFNTSSVDNNPDVDPNEGSSAILIPGIHMALEVFVTEWFAFRGGLEAGWRISSDNAEGDEDGSSSRGASFGWSSGFGLIFDRFKLDFALADSFWTRGPYIVSGNSGTFAATAAASYSF